MPPGGHIHSHTLPHPHHSANAVALHQQNHPTPPMSPPQVGMVHPISHANQQQSHPHMPPPPPPPNTYALEHHSSMPRMYSQCLSII